MDLFYIVTYASILIFNFLGFLYKDYSYKQKENQRLDKEILRIPNNDYTNIIISLVCVFFTIIILGYAAYILAPEYMFLNKYFDNALQWFNLTEIEKLREYFLKQDLVPELLKLIEYKKLLLSVIFMIIGVFGSVLNNYVVGKRDVIFYEDGVLVSEEVCNWDDLIGFTWSDLFETKFKKVKLYKLILTFESAKSDLNYKCKIKVNYENKQAINNILIKYFKIDDELQLRFLPFPVIPTKRLVIRKLRLEDKNEIFNLKSNEDMLKYLDNKKHENIEESEKYIKKINDGILNNEWIQWGITLKDMDTVIGTICLCNISKENKTAEIGYELIPDYQGKGIMNEALKAVIKYAFNVVKLSALTAYTNKENIKSINLLENNKFYLESEEGNYKIFKLKKV